MFYPFIAFDLFNVLMKSVLFSLLSRQGRGSEQLWASFKVLVREWQSLFSPLGLMSLRTQTLTVPPLYINSPLKEQLKTQSSPAAQGHQQIAAWLVWKVPS